MRLYYVRHGQSENNLLWLEEGSRASRVPDPLLTPTGEAQVEALASFLAIQDSSVGEWEEGGRGGFNITHCYTSLMERAVATGHRIAQALGLPLRGWADLHELGGMYSYDAATETYSTEMGRSRRYLLDHYPTLALPPEVGAEGWWQGPREAKEDRLPRAERVLARLLARHSGSGDQVVMVSHGGFFTYLMYAVLGIGPSANLWFALDNGSVSRIDFDADDQVYVGYTNRRDFLLPALVT